MDLFLFEYVKKFKSNAISQIKRIISAQDSFRRRFHFIFDSRIITNSFLHALRTGNWAAARRKGLNEFGVAQDLKRDTNYLATLSHLRKVCAPFFHKSRSVSNRNLHNTHFGMYCPSETPEGMQIGIIKHLAFLVIITHSISDQEYDVLLKCIK